MLSILGMSDNRSVLIRQLLSAHQSYSLPGPLRAESERFAHRILGLLFPHFSRVGRLDAPALGREVLEVERTLGEIQSSLSSQYPRQDAALPARFVEDLPDIYTALRMDADQIYQDDPAAESIDEVILSYPGFLAIAVYRIAHRLCEYGMPFLPRLLTEFAHRETGVDIHPGAQIGRRFVIDHGTGVVIGQTTVIGNNVKLFQGVTLGALTVSKELATVRRHPTLEDNVVVYSNATILGGQTVIGHDSVIGGNAWLTHSVPPFSVVSHRSEIKPRTHPNQEMDFNI